MCVLQLIIQTAIDALTKTKKRVSVHHISHLCGFSISQTLGATAIPVHTDPDEWRTHQTQYY